MQHYKINVADYPTANRITVRRPKGLYGELSSYIGNLHRKQFVDRVLLVNGRIVWIGGKEYAENRYQGEPTDYVNMEHERKLLKDWIEVTF